MRKSLKIAIGCTIAVALVVPYAIPVIKTHLGGNLRNGVNYDAYKVEYHANYLAQLVERIGSTNSFEHSRHLADHTSDVITPAIDHLYSKAVLDLTDGYVVMTSAGATDRYTSYHLTDQEHYVPIGGHEARPVGQIIIAREDFTGELPEGKVVRTKSTYPHMFLRVQVHNDDDLANANKVQDQFIIHGVKRPLVVPEDLIQWTVDTSFPYKGTRKHLTNLGDYDYQATENQLTHMINKTTGKRNSEGMFDSYEEGSMIPMFRAAALYVGHLGLPATHAVYDTLITDCDGQQVSGTKPVVITLPHNPGIKEFWSITRYDSATRLPIEGEKDKLSSGEMKPDAQGNVTITFSVTDPKDGTSWLSVPEGDWYAVGRFYVPTDKLSESPLMDALCK
jgi:hypothetical protein